MGSPALTQVGYRMMLAESDRDGIGRVRKIAVEKGRPSTSGLITGVPPVTFCTGSSESDHSGT